jgi:hypothetical protein
MKRQELAPEIVEMYETPLTLEEFERRMAVMPSEEEIAEFMDLVRWFTGRYPTAKARFAYVRRKYAEWTRNPPARIAATQPAVAADDTPAHAPLGRVDRLLE